MATDDGRGGRYFGAPAQNLPFVPRGTQPISARGGRYFGAPSASAAAAAATPKNPINFGGARRFNAGSPDTLEARKNIGYSDYQPGGGMSAEEQRMAELAAILEALGLGGGGGGGGYYDPRPEIQAQYQAQRDKAATRKGEVSGEYTKLYGQLADAYKPLEAQTGQRYQQAAAQSAAGSQELINATQSRINEEAAKRAAAYAELGIEGPQATAGEATGQAAEAQNAMGNLSQISGNWAGLMGAQQQAEQGRNQLDYTGAVDAGTLAQEQLTRNYNAFLDNLALQEQADLASAQPSYSGGGGGGGGSSIPSGIQSALWNEYFTGLGLLPEDTSNQPAPYTPSKYERAIDLFGPDAVNAYYAGKDSKTWNPANKNYNSAISGYLSSSNN